MSDKAKVGNKVTVNYVGKLDDGTVFDTTDDHGPFQFELGKDQLISGFANAVEGMTPGETKTVKIPPAEAYGEKRQDMVVLIKQEWIPDGVAPQVGQQMELQQKDGSKIDVRVVGVDDSGVTVDGNHPLAGQTLTFEIALLELA